MVSGNVADHLWEAYMRSHQIDKFCDEILCTVVQQRPTTVLETVQVLELQARVSANKRELYVSKVTDEDKSLKELSPSNNNGDTNSEQQSESHKNREKALYYLRLAKPELESFRQMIRNAFDALTVEPKVIETESGETSFNVPKPIAIETESSNDYIDGHARLDQVLQMVSRFEVHLKDVHCLLADYCLEKGFPQSAINSVLSATTMPSDGYAISINLFEHMVMVLFATNAVVQATTSMYEAIALESANGLVSGEKIMEACEQHVWPGIGNNSDESGAETLRAFRSLVSRNQSANGFMSLDILVGITVDCFCIIK